MSDAEIIFRLFLTVVFFLCLGYLPLIYRVLKQKERNEQAELQELRNLNEYLRKLTQRYEELEQKYGPWESE